jgi:hypothetical protein
MGEEWDAELEEGLLDRIKARMSGVGGMGGAAKERAKGTIQYGLKGRADSTEGALGDAYQRGKASKIINLYGKKIGKISTKTAETFRKQAQELEKDLEKLGLELTGDVARQIEFEADNIGKAINGRFQQVVNQMVGKIQQTSGAGLQPPTDKGEGTATRPPAAAQPAPAGQITDIATAATSAAPRGNVVRLPGGRQKAVPAASGRQAAE